MSDQETPAEMGRRLGAKHGEMLGRSAVDLAKAVRAEGYEQGVADERSRVLRELTGQQFITQLAATGVLDRKPAIKAMAALGSDCAPEEEGYLLLLIMREAASLLAPEEEGDDRKIESNHHAAPASSSGDERGEGLVDYVAQGLYERFAASAWPSGYKLPHWTEETDEHRENWRGLSRSLLPPSLVPFLAPARSEVDGDR